MKTSRYSFQGKWALVTGASSGIGKAFAHELARRGTNVVLSARSQHALEELAQKLETQFKVATAAIALDLAEPKAPERLLSAVEERHIPVRVLINNAGFGTYGKLHENDLEQNGRQILLNVSSLALLTQLFLPAMVAKRDGVIINVASTAGFQPTPYMAVYGATKAFVLSFSEALWAENQETGVHILALCPGPVETSFFKVLGSEEPASTGRMESPENTVATAFRALDEGRSYVVTGGVRNYLLTQSNRFTPRAMVTRISEKMLRPRMHTVAEAA
ncbi:MAG TPA: SDR family oxidoreductase [Chthoniobacterales bacterium]